MRRIVVKAAGGPEQLSVESAENLRSEPGTLLVQVEAAGINYLDVYQRNGASKVQLPHPIGLEGVGRIIDIGPGVPSSAELVVGRRIAWINAKGSYADQIVLPASQAIPIPDALLTGQSLLFQAVTAQYLVAEYRTVRPGDRVLVHAAAGGVGQLLVQWLKHLGAWVVGTTSNVQKAGIIRALGADAVINYGRDYTFLDELKSLTSGFGVDLAFDAIGAGTFANSVKALAPRGTAVSYGSASGPPPSINPLDLIVPGTRIAGGSLFSYTADPVELQQRAKAVISGIQSGWLRPDNGTGYPLDRAPDAHRAIESRATAGKLFLTP